MRRLKKFITVITLAALILVGCAASKDSAQSGNDYGAMPNESGENRTDFLQKIIKSSNISMNVDKLDDTMVELNKIIEVYDGYITSLEKYSGEHSNSAHLSIKVPSENYEAMHESIISLGKVSSDISSTEDVTEDYIDLTARINMLKDSKAAYTRLLTKAKSVEEILQVEKELERIVYEIESTQGKLDYLNNQVQMSSIHLVIREKAMTEFEGINIFERGKFAIKEGFNTMLNIIVNLVIMLIWLIPFIPFIILIIFLLKKIKVKWKNRRRGK